VATTSCSTSTVPASAPAAPSLYCGGKEPVFLAAIAFSLGIIAANYFWRPPQSWLAACLVALLGAASFYRRSPQVAFGLTLVALLPLGGFYLQARDAAAPAIAENLQPFANGDDQVDVTAYVIREGLVRDSPYGGKQESVDVTAERLQLDDHVLKEAVGIRLTIYSKQAEEDEARDAGTASPLRVYSYGQRLRFVAKLRMPRNYRNPGAMDMAGYLASQDIRLTGSTHASSVELLPGFVGSRIGLWRSAARRSVLAHIMQLWPGERGALMQAMLIGGRAFFGRDIKTEFQRTGTYHILVVSGINVDILAFAVFWALRKLPFGETWATILTILLSWGYAFLADLGSPIVRATITLGIYLVTRLLFRDRAALNGLGIAALGILLVNPRTLSEASFQLTFLSVIAVAGIAVPILRRTAYPLRRALGNLDSPAFDVALPTRSGTISFRRATGSQPGREYFQSVGCEPRSGRRHSICLGCGRTAVYVHRYLDRARIAYGMVLPPRHYHGVASQCAGNPDRRNSVARCGGCCGGFLYRSLVGVVSGADHPVRSRRVDGHHSRHRPLAGL
jgi:competence protein ComEC